MTGKEIINDTVKLSQAMSEKICHDLSGCATTIDGCVDLIENDSESLRQQARDLLMQTSYNLTRLITFFRGVYGLGSATKMVGTDSLHEPIKQFLQASKIIYSAYIAPDVDEVPLPLSKALSSLLSISAERMQSGNLDLYVSENLQMAKVVCRGNYFPCKKECNIKVDCNNFEGLSVHNVREYYINILLQECGYNITYSEQSNFFEYSLNKTN